MDDEIEKPRKRKNRSGPRRNRIALEFERRWAASARRLKKTISWPLRALRFSPQLSDDRSLLLPSLSTLKHPLGMAFEYLVRAQLERMNPKATTGLWLAEEAFDFAKKRLSEGHSLSVEMDCLITGMGRPTRPSLPAENPHQILAELYDLLNQTKNLHARFVTTGKLNRDLLECYLKLARFHGWLVGTGSVVVPYNLNQVDQRAVYELEAMFDLVKWDNFKASRRCLLRPQFRNYSKYGVNEPDLVIDDMIVDLKATASGSLDRRDIDKLFKYFALAELDGLKGRRKGGINKLALYFSRFADWLIIDLRNDYPPEKIEKFLEWHRKKRTQKAN